MAWIEFVHNHPPLLPGLCWFRLVVKQMEVAVIVPGSQEVAAERREAQMVVDKTEESVYSECSLDWIYCLYAIYDVR